MNDDAKAIFQHWQRDNSPQERQRLIDAARWTPDQIRRFLDKWRQPPGGRP